MKKQFGFVFSIILAVSILLTTTWVVSAKPVPQTAPTVDPVVTPHIGITTFSVTFLP